MDIQERAARVKLLLMDVDGVLTDGRIYNVPGPDGQWSETKGFDTQDGIALQWMHWHGIQTGVISGRVSPAVELRASQVHMSYCYQGHIEKIPIFDEILEKSGLEREQIAYMGDDLTDVVLLKRVGFAIAVANARPEVKECAHYVTVAPGGRGALREVAELVLRAGGQWGKILSKYEIAYGQ